jgi:beta-lactam-binding protein with PASTA domain
MHSKRTFVVLIALASLSTVFAAGCASAKPQHVPDVRGDRLDYAEAKLEAGNLSYEIFGGGKLGVIVESNWWVCSQKPGPGRWATKVRLVVAESCADVAEIPQVVGMNLHRARKVLEAKGFAVDAQTEGEYYDGDYDEEIVVERNWQVCEQEASSSRSQRSVELIVDHHC